MGFTHTVTILQQKYSLWKNTGLLSSMHLQNLYKYHYLNLHFTPTIFNIALIRVLVTEVKLVHKLWGILLLSIFYLFPLSLGF